MTTNETCDTLTEILYLALTAPDDTRAERCAAIAELLAMTLTADEIDACKQAALEQAGMAA